MSLKIARIKLRRLKMNSAENKESAINISTIIKCLLIKLEILNKSVVSKLTKSNRLIILIYLLLEEIHKLFSRKI
jgi:hypothetical protein